MMSMTGFGRAGGEVLGVRCGVEIRSVNHRHLDLKLRLPPAWQDATIEHLCQQLIRRRVDRGSLSVTIRDEGRVRGETALRVDVELGRAYGRALQSLVRELPLAASPQVDAQILALVAAQPGVLQSSDQTTSAEQRFLHIEPLLEQALQELAQTRAREGAALADDLLGRLQLMDAHLTEVAKLSEQAPELLRLRLTERVSRLLQDSAASGAVDGLRLAQEVAHMADRVDITEELTRLRAHFVEFDRLCRVDQQAGRRLDFLTQEMNREVNTIGSKAQSSEVAARVVAMKAELERLREQIQNVE